MESFELLNKLTLAINFKYSDDRIAPGLILSCLADRRYYCSIVRYNGVYEGTKEVVCKSDAYTLEEAVKNVAHQFLKITSCPKNPIQDLERFLNKEG